MNSREAFEEGPGAPLKPATANFPHDDMGTPV